VELRGQLLEACGQAPALLEPADGTRDDVAPAIGWAIWSLRSGMTARTFFARSQARIAPAL